MNNKVGWLLPGESQREKDPDNDNTYLVRRIKGRKFQDVLETRTSTGEIPDALEPNTKTTETITVVRHISNVTEH